MRQKHKNISDYPHYLDTKQSPGNIEEKLYQLASIVEHADVAISSVSQEGIIESWNQGAEQIYGYTAKEAIGKSYDVSVPKEYQKELSDMLETIRKGKHIAPFETRRKRKNGAYIDVFLTISPRKDSNGTIIGTSHIARDITKRKEAERALKESEERYRSVITALQEGIILVDNKGKVQTCNDSAASILGLSKNVVLGMSPLDKGWYVIHEDGKPFTEKENPVAISLKQASLW